MRWRNTKRLDEPPPYKGKAGLGSNVATEIKVLDITGRAESRAEKLFKDAFKN